MANISKIKLEYYQISSGEDLVAKLGSVGILKKKHQEIITIIFLKLESVEKEKESLYSIRNEFRIRREQLLLFRQIIRITWLVLWEKKASGKLSMLIQWNF